MRFRSGMEWLELETGGAKLLAWRRTREIWRKGHEFTNLERPGIPIRIKHLYFFL